LGLALAEDPLSPYECVREGRAAWDVRLCSFHLCGSCVAEWTAGAFRGEPPVFDVAVLSGSCQNCTRVASDLHLAQWLLCGNCESSRTRPRETKTAAYYSTDRFRPFEEFEEHWRSGKMASVQRRFEEHGLPSLYR